MPLNLANNYILNDKIPYCGKKRTGQLIMLMPITECAELVVWLTTCNRYVPSITFSSSFLCPLAQAAGIPFLLISGASVPMLSTSVFPFQGLHISTSVYHIKPQLWGRCARHQGGHVAMTQARRFVPLKRFVCPHLRCRTQCDTYYLKTIELKTVLRSMEKFLFRLRGYRILMISVP